MLEDFRARKARVDAERRRREDSGEHAAQDVKLEERLRLMNQMWWKGTPYLVQDHVMKARRHNVAIGKTQHVRGRPRSKQINDQGPPVEDAEAYPQLSVWHKSTRGNTTCRMYHMRLVVQKDKKSGKWSFGIFPVWRGAFDPFNSAPLYNSHKEACVAATIEAYGELNEEQRSEYFDWYREVAKEFHPIDPRRG